MKCRFCFKPLTFWIDAQHPEQGRGYAGDGAFCSLRCAYAFAMAQLGLRTPVRGGRRHHYTD